MRLRNNEIEKEQNYLQIPQTHRNQKKAKLILELKSVHIKNDNKLLYILASSKKTVENQ